MLSSRLLPLFPLVLFACSPIATGQASAGPRVRNVAILVYEGVELLDFAGPGEVFSAAHHRGHGGGAGGGQRAFRVYTVAKTREPVTSQGFVELTPGHSLADCPAPDIVVVPGGNVPSEDPELQRWLAERARSCELVMSVCNGALLLGAAGLLDGLEVTTHHGSLQALARLTPRARVLSNRRFVDCGRILTCAGVSAGIDGALHVVERLLGAEEARGVARYMEYDWRPEELARLHAEPPRDADETEWTHLALAVEEHGLERALDDFRRLAHAPGEAELDRAGHVLLGSGKSARAVALFRLAAAAFPASASAADSLSEACERAGDAPLALQHAREALARLEQEPGLSEERAGRIRNPSASRIVRLENGDRSRLRFGCPPCGGGCDELRYLAVTACPGCGMALVERGSAGD